MKGFLCLKQLMYILLILPQISLAQKKPTVWIKAPQTLEAEFEAYLKALGSLHISYAKYKFFQQRKQVNFFQLKKKLLSAQDFYLSGKGRRALRAFKQITDKAFSADWGRESRRILLYSFLRQAQSEENPAKRKALLLSASGFALNGLASSDQDIFPPPLIKEFRQIQTKAYRLKVDWKDLFPDHEIILINGKQISNAMKIPQGVYRVSAFSSSHKSWSENLSLSELLQKKVKTERLTQGICENLEIISEEAGKNIKLLPVSSCPESLQIKFVENSSKNLNNISSNLKSPLFNSNDILNDFRDARGKRNSEKSNIPPWLVAGAGILTIFVIASLSHGGRNQKPSYSRGEYIY